MPTNQQLVIGHLFAGQDHAANQYRLVKGGGTEQEVDLSVLAADNHLGFLQNAPGLNEPATVCNAGTSFAIAGAAITYGAALTSDTTGRVIAQSTGENIVGSALQTAGAAGERILVSVTLAPSP